MNTLSMRHFLAGFAVLGLVACGGGGGGSGERDVDNGIPSLPTEPTGPADEVAPTASAPDLANRPASGNFDMVYLVIDSGSMLSGDLTLAAGTGALTGPVLGGRDLDEVAIFTNPANGEFSRIVEISSDSIFGVVGLEASDLPTSGTITNYNEGWVRMAASVEGNTFVLTGDAEFEVAWGSSDIDGRFFNLSGTSDIDGSVTNVGTIVLTNGGVSGDTFSGGVATGTGIFADLSASGGSVDVDGSFFGPEADELGGTFDINDVNDDIRASGAFQAD